MVLENFLADADILWDRAGKKLFEKPEARTGRIMRVQVTNRGVVEDLTGYTLNLGWTSTKDETKIGLDAFEAADITKGIFELEYTSGMLANIGTLKATLQLVPVAGNTVESDNFVITVTKSAVDAEAIQSESSFSTLTTALVQVNGWNTTIDGKITDWEADMAATKQTYIDNMEEVEATYPQELLSITSQLADIEIVADTAAQKADAMASGSPKGVYTTLALLQAAYPTGTTGAYLVTADGKWYYWSGSAWAVGGVYQSTGLAVDGVMVDNLNAEAKNGLIEYTRAISQSEFEVFPAHFSYLTGQVNGVNTKYVQFGSPYTTYNWFKLKGSITTFIATYSDSILPPYIVLCGNATECLALEMSTGKIYHCTTTTSVLKTTIAVAEQIVRYDTLKIENANGVITVHVLNGAVYDLIATIDLTTIDVTFNAEYGLGFMGSASYRREPWVYDLKQYVKNYDFLTDTDISSLQSDISTLNAFKTTTENELSDINSAILNLGGNNKIVDLVMFMGQSNMAGRGTSAQAPIVPTGRGFEFKSISDPTKLYDIVEPFGYAENVVGSVNDGTSKTGSMVSAFANAYYSLTKVPIVGVSASQGNTGIDLWSYANNGWFIPIHDRLDNAVTWLNANGYTIRHKYMVWCQGETDGDNAMTKADYIAKFKLFADYWTGLGIEKIFIIRIGNNRDNATLYDVIIDAQTELGKTYDKCVLISTRLANMAVEGLMKDQFHYTQIGYNIVGEDAGKNMAFYVNNLKEPIMYDSEYSNLYYSTN